jgi:uncharacterized protein YqjF (DUF2071 family)
MSTYDPNMPSALDRYRVFDERWSDKEDNLKVPKDLKILRDKVLSPNMDNIDEAQGRAEYKE